MSQLAPINASFPNLQGFAHGLRQPAQLLTFTLHGLPSQIRWTDVDAWLQVWLDEPLCELPEEEKWLEAGESCADAARLAWRVAVGAATLLRACGIPFFEPGHVLAVSQADLIEGNWRCDLAVPRVEGISPQTLMVAYETCVKWLIDLATYPENTDPVSPFYQQLESHVLPALLASSAISSSGMILLRAAREQDVPWSYEGQGICQLGWGEKSRRVQSTCLESDSVLGISAAGNKLLAAQWLRRAGLPTPEHHLVSNVDHAVQAAHLLGWPVVVKPIDRECGEGVSIDIDNDAKLRKAFMHARSLSTQVLVERQVAGICHRVLVVHGEIMYVVKRLPVSVQGDGCHTVAELIAIEMDYWRKMPPWHRPPPLLGDTLAETCLRQAGLSLTAIPAEGTWAPLRRIESSADGGRSEDMGAVLHPENKALAIRAAAVFEMDVAGVDIISTDIGLPWYMNGAIINEINASPAMGVSPSSQAAMPTVIQHLVGNGGRIRIEAFVGGDAALKRAQQRQQELIVDGTACYLTSHHLTLDNSGHIEPMACEGLFLRCRALLMDKSVGAIVLAVQNDEWLDIGLPVDRLDRVEKVDDSAQGHIEELLSLLRHHAGTYNN